jgi:hypothetical protein
VKSVLEPCRAALDEIVQGNLADMDAEQPQDEEPAAELTVEDMCQEVVEAVKDNKLTVDDWSAKFIESTEERREKYGSLRMSDKQMAKLKELHDLIGGSR